MVATVENESEIKTRRGVSLDPEEDRMAQELANRYHGDNVSRLLRHLIRAEWEREQEKAVA
jgi:hypothetical protein